MGGRAGAAHHAIMVDGKKVTEPYTESCDLNPLPIHTGTQTFSSDEKNVCITVSMAIRNFTEHCIVADTSIPWVEYTK